jgi:hypothetical protein
MRAKLEIQDGPHAGRSFELQAGQIGQVGSSGWADFRIPDDPELGDVHFVFACGASACSVRDLDTATGTFVNGVKVDRALLRDGDHIRAGVTTFVVRHGRVALEPGPAAAPPGPARTVPPDAPWAARLLSVLRSQEQPLFAVLDAARAPEVLALLVQHGEATSQSLYEGIEGEALAAVAPHLVELPAPSPLLETLATRGWGQSWGIYLTCDRPFAEVRKHLRRFLMAELEGGKRVYFRYYDPRVLRVYLPTCNAQESQQFFGPIRGFLLEGETAHALLKFTPTGQGPKRTSEALSEAAQPTP